MGFYLQVLVATAAVLVTYAGVKRYALTPHRSTELSKPCRSAQLCLPFLLDRVPVSGCLL